VAEWGGRVIRLDDVAGLEAGDRQHEMARCDGNAAVALGVYKAFGSDAAALRRTLRERLPALRSTLPEDVDLTVLEGPVSSGASDWLLLDVEPPGGMRPQQVAEVLVELEKRLAAVPERASVLTYLRPPNAPTRPLAHCFLQLLPARGRPTELIQADVRKAVEDLPAARVTVHQVVSRGGVPVRKRTFEVLVEAEELDDVSRLTPRLRDALAEGGYVTEAQSDDVELQPQPMLIPRREQALARGVEFRMCYELLSAVLGGCSVGKWEVDGRKQRVTVVLGDGAGQGGEVLRGLFVRGADGREVPLTEMFEVRHVAGAAALYRHDGKRGARIMGNVAPGRSPTEVFAKCRELAAELGVPAGGRVIAGRGRD
jgi:multidrug efflux pump subunit AcrB